MNKVTLGVLALVLGGAVAWISRSMMRKEGASKGSYTFWSFWFSWGILVVILGLARIVL